MSAEPGPRARLVRPSAPPGRRAGAGILAAALIAGPGLAAADGLYVRTGVGVDGVRNSRFLDRACSSTAPPALYGCGPGSDGAPLGTAGDFGGIEVIEAGVGYSVAPALRVEALVEGRPAFWFSGNANFLRVTDRQPVSADLSTLSTLLAAYADLSEIGLPRTGPFRAFVGAGAGLSRIRMSKTLMEFPGIGPNAVTIVPGGASFSVAWMAAAGASVSVTTGIALDIAWRYAHTGRVRTDQGEATIVRPTRTLDLEIAATEARIAGHGLRASLRYSF